MKFHLIVSIGTFSEYCSRRLSREKALWKKNVEKTLQNASIASLTLIRAVELFNKI